MIIHRNKSVSGIYNCGTGKAQQFNDVALTVVNTLREQEGKAALSLAEAVNQGFIEYIPFPEALVGNIRPTPRQTSPSSEKPDVKSNLRAFKKALVCTCSNF